MVISRLHSSLLEWEHIVFSILKASGMDASCYSIAYQLICLFDSTWDTLTAQVWGANPEGVLELGEQCVGWHFVERALTQAFASGVHEYLAAHCAGARIWLGRFF